MTVEPAEAFVATRAALHAVAEHVLAAARYQAIGRIGLTDTRDGFGTPPFGPDGRVVAVEGTDLVVRTGGVESGRAPLTTLRAAADFAGITLGGPADVYRLSTPCEPDRPLALDPGAARRIADWYRLGGEALRRWREIVAADAPGEVTLWPEHADIALRAAEINYGASPGDGYVPAPYLYVGPPTPPPPSADGFWNASFGAYLTWDQVPTVDDALAFFGRGRAEARA